MRKTLGKPMMCPFRIEERFKYTNLDDKALVVESKTEKFMSCYKTKCPMYKWDADERDFVCKKAQMLFPEDIEGAEDTEGPIL